MNRKYPVVKQKQDERDYVFVGAIDLSQLPKSVDLRPLCPPIYDQGNLGSCTANAGAASYSMLIKQPNKLFSRLFLYHQERVLEHTVNQDAGAQMREIGRTLGKYGVCEEQYMPYTDKGLLESPSKEAFGNALQHRITQYHSVRGLSGIKQALAQSKPVLIGMVVFESFETQEVAATGLLPMPKSNEENLGGHAVLVVGYDDEKQVLIVRNSWGVEWGDKGYFYMPYSYVNSGLAYDFWVLDK